MLKELIVSNYRSFVNEAFFTMEAAPKKEISEYCDTHVVSMNHNRLLKMSSIYGPNGGGKSNLLGALLLLRSVALGEEIAKRADNESWSSLFLDDDVIRIKASFVTERWELAYSLSFALARLDCDETMRFERLGRSGGLWAPRIVEETLDARKAGESAFSSVYVRDEGGRVESKGLAALDLVAHGRPVSPKQSFLMLVSGNFADIEATGEFGEAIACLFALRKQVESIVRLVGNPPDPYLKTEAAAQAIEAQEKAIVALLRAAGIALDGVRVQKDKIYGNTVFLIRKTEDKEYALDLLEESTGTQRLFSIALRLLSRAQEDRIYLADDLDSALHPRLIRNLLSFFLSREKSRAQLIFNSHDVLNMEPGLFRRDEIWFAYKDENASTCLTPLSSLTNYKGERIRKDAQYGKQYIEGKYVGDPFIQKGLGGWKDEV